ncbi:zinc finger protein 12-like isoform X2 [Osmia bicornis bicornis]|uniref:zinc finger protein 12-like isoform X2 n=1 Tax=Osmia bicornis bicornis TaxID=1437191 RepID=UPI001EAF3EBB|nr:zinc finger protein 12-like isoform X2 [Osmia bicornis bicornis]
MSSLDYLDLCRLCLVKDRVSVPIFEGEGDVRQIFLKIAACLPVKVTREDKLPKKICDDCVYKVELFYQFWNTTANAEKQLLQWLGEVNIEDKQGYVTNVLNPNVMKQEQRPENRLDGNVMQQVGEHQNNMGMGMMDNMGLGIPMMISNANQQQQITSVPMDTSGNSVQPVQAVPGPSSQTTHNQISQNQSSSTQQEDEEESSEDEENSDDECDGDEGLPVKEESEEDPNNRTIEPTTFVNVSLACDEAGPSGLQQKISDIPEMPMPQTADGDPKTGRLAKASLCQGKDRAAYKGKSIPASKEDRSDTLLMKVERDSENEDNDNADSDLVMNETGDSTGAVKTVLVPVRNPITKQVKNTLVPVEMKDKSGLNIIKSVLIPFQSDDGSVSYEIKRVAVPAPFELDILRRNLEEARKNLEETRKNFKETEKITEEKEEEPNPAPQEMYINMEEKFLDTEEKMPEEEKNESENTSEETVDQSLQNSCPLCQKNFKNQTEMLKHVRRTHRKRYSCDMCQKRCGSEAALEEHQKTHEGASFLQCSICKLKYKTTLGLKNHYIRKHSTVDPKFTCDYCGRCFKLKHDLGIHIDRIHLNPPEYICRFCGRVVKNILNHEATHEEEANKDTTRYRCDHCPKEFKLLNGLANHLLKKHNDRQPSMLRTLCEQSFESSKDFYQHVLPKEKIDSYKCNICGKIYANEQNLRKHVSVHSQTYKCHPCGKTFANNYSLKLHLRMHTGERPYQCKVCLKPFSRTNTLRVHQLTHTGKRPYICDLCGQSFTQRSTMMGHRRKHPGNHPPPPPLCLTKLEINEH